MTAASTPTQSSKREREIDDAALMPPAQIFKREGNDAPPGVDPRKLLELHVQDTNDMWWAMPRDLSTNGMCRIPTPRAGYQLHVQDTNGMWWVCGGLLESRCSGENLKVLYVGDWDEARACYVIDFSTMRQRKIHTKCEYRIKIVEVLAKGAATE